VRQVGFPKIPTAILSATLISLASIAAIANPAQATPPPITSVQLTSASAENGYLAVPSVTDGAGQQVEILNNDGGMQLWSGYLVGHVSQSSDSPFTNAALDQEYTNHPYFEFIDTSNRSLCLGQKSGDVELENCASSGTIYWVLTDYDITGGLYSGRLINVERSDYVGTAQVMYTIGQGDDDKVRINKDGTTGDWEKWSFTAASL
jgi:hypothetical protein